MADLFKVLLADEIDADHVKIGDRLKANLKQLKFDSGKDCWTLGECLDDDGNPTPDSVNLEFHETKKCEQRAADLVKRRLASNGMSHLKKDDFERIQPLLKGAHLKSHLKFISNFRGSDLLLSTPGISFVDPQHDQNQRRLALSCSTDLRVSARRRGHLTLRTRFKYLCPALMPAVGPVSSRLSA